MPFTPTIAVYSRLFTRRPFSGFCTTLQSAQILRERHCFWRWILITTLTPFRKNCVWFFVINFKSFTLFGGTHLKLRKSQSLILCKSTPNLVFCSCCHFIESKVAITFQYPFFVQEIFQFFLISQNSVYKDSVTGQIPSKPHYRFDTFS